MPHGQFVFDAKEGSLCSVGRLGEVCGIETERAAMADVESAWETRRAAGGRGAGPDCTCCGWGQLVNSSVESAREKSKKRNELKNLCEPAW